MKIVPINDCIGSHKMHSLSSDITIEQIEAALPGCINVFSDGASDDGKVDYYWAFSVDGVEHAIWAYYGVKWSAYGPADTFKVLGLM